MVDEVKVLDANGYIMPPWATEKTLQDLVKVLNPSSANKPTKGEEDVTRATKEAALRMKVLEEKLSKLGETLTEIQKLDTEGKRQDRISQITQTAETKKVFNKSLADFSLTIKDSFSNPESIMGAWKGSLRTWGDSLTSAAQYNDNLSEDSKKRYSVLGSSLTEASKNMRLFARSYETVMKLDKSFLDLYDTGMRFDHGMSGMVNSIMDTGLNLEQFAKVTKSNVQATAMFGTSTPKMIAGFMNLTSQGGQLIMSQEQAAESFMSASEIYQNAGLRQGMTSEQLSTKSMQLVKDINSLSQATGQSRTEILKFVNETFKNPETIALMSTMPKQIQEGFTEFTKNATLLGPVAGKQINDMMSKMVLGNGSFGLFDEKQSQLMAAFPELSKGMQGLYADMKEGHSNVQSMANLAASLSSMDPEKLKMVMRGLGPEMGAFVGEIIKNKKIYESRAEEEKKQLKVYMDQGKSEEEARNIITKKRERQEQADAKLQSDINQSLAGFNKVWMAQQLPLIEIGKVVLGGLGLFAKLLGPIAWAAGGLINVFDSVMEKLDPAIDWLDEKFKGLGYIIKDVLIPAIQLAALAMAVGFGPGKMLRGVKGLMGGGMLGKLFGAPAAEAAVVGETALAGEAVLGGGSLMGGLAAAAPLAIGGALAAGVGGIGYGSSELAKSAGLGKWGRLLAGAGAGTGADGFESQLGTREDRSAVYSSSPRSTSM